MRKTLVLLLVVFAIVGCESNRPASPQPAPGRDKRVTAASMFTQRYDRSRFRRWNIRATAAGLDCAVLLVETSIIMDDSMIEAMHYGAGAYDVYDGGVDRFSHDRTFRGTAYRDETGRIWTFGAVTDTEPLMACH